MLVGNSASRKSQASTALVLSSDFLLAISSCNTLLSTWSIDPTLCHVSSLGGRELLDFLDSFGNCNCHYHGDKLRWGARCDSEAPCLSLSSGSVSVRSVFGFEFALLCSESVTVLTSRFIEISQILQVLHGVLLWCLEHCSFQFWRLHKRGHWHSGNMWKHGNIFMFTLHVEALSKLICTVWRKVQARDVAKATSYLQESTSQESSRNIKNLACSCL